MSDKVAIIENVLKENSLNLFSDDWYRATSIKISNSLGRVEIDGGYVYGFLNPITKQVKIGMSINVEKRKASIETNTGELTLLFKIHSRVYSELETVFHKNFKKYRTYGEWFKFDDIKILKDYVKTFDGLELCNFDCFSLTDNSYLENKFKQFILKPNTKINNSYIHEHSTIGLGYDISKTKITRLFKTYLKSNNIKYIDGKSGSDRWIMIIN